MVVSSNRRIHSPVHPATGGASNLARGLLVLGLCLIASCSDVRILAVEIARIELHPATTAILVGDSIKLEARLLDGSGNLLHGHQISFASSHPATAPVDGVGLVRGIAPGEATITATSEGWQATAEVAVERLAPVLTGVSPASVQRLQAVDLVLTGSNFEADATTVDLGDGVRIDGAQVTAPGSMDVRVTILAGAPLGPRTITVTNPPPGGGTATLPGALTILAEHPTPILSGASPSTGQRQESLDVVLAGSGFVQGLTAVDFGPGIEVSTVEVASATSLTAHIHISAIAALGPRNVTVSNPAPGGGTATLAEGFTVRPENPTPVVDHVEPAAVQRRDALDVTLTGDGFISGLTTVSFGPDIIVNDVRVTGSTSLTANIRIGAGAVLGSRPVAATNPAPGGGTGILEAGLTILEENPTPTLTAVIPESGSQGRTLNVTLVGSGFVQGLTSVSFGPGIAVTGLSVHLWTSLSVTISIANDATVGSRDVAVTNVGPGGGTSIMAGGFFVLPSSP